MTLPLLDLLPTPPPRVPLGDFPSPIDDLPGPAELLGIEQLLIKRDDLNGNPFGGNKLRALEWLLPGAGPAMVTMGGYGSTWSAALAVAAARRGQRAYPALFPQPWSVSVAGALSLTLVHGHPEIASSRSRLPLAVLRAWRAARRHGPVSWIPAGGASPLGVLGSVNAMLEFSRQVDGLAARPQAIVVPLGSGGTAAGLLVGAWLAGWDLDVCAVRVTDPWFANHRRVLSLADQTMRLLRIHGLAARPGSARLRVLGGELGAGYGHPTASGLEAQARLATSGIALDLTYGAKAFAAMNTLAHSYRRLCFWHTFDRRLSAGAAVDHPLLREARTVAESLWPHPKSI